MFSPRKLSKMVRNQSDGGNSTTVDLTNLPEKLLESFVPGYAFFSGYIQQALGFDISILVSFIAVIFALLTGSQYLARKFGGVFDKYCTSTITIDQDDEIYHYIMSWIADNESLQRVRTLQAVSDHSGFDSMLNEDAKQITDDEELFNFSNWESRIPPKYTPAIGAHWFWYKGNFFKFERRRDPSLKDGFFGDKVLGQEKTINLTVLGLSTAPAKKLILEARDKSLSQESSKTIVRRPSPKEQRGRGRQAWMRVATRPSRPMDTVVLDAVEKSLILRDINEFVHPASVQWYANRGIPYRRGYLFHGPPGTGKTSLSFAIAGVFGFDIYCISLLEPTLTEEDLSILFNNLPSRCVVLLEDIDAAGLHRKKEEAEEDDKKKKEKSTEKEDSSTIIAKEVAKAFKDVSDEAKRNRGPRGANNDQQGISLSGLLNAIDGVASPEGRILVMTTNHPEKLDEALVRPGRVDMKIAFTLATKQQIKELFLRMYISDRTISLRKKPTRVSEIVAPTFYPSDTVGADLKPSETSASSSETNSKKGEPELGDKVYGYDQKALFKLADEFSTRLPEKAFSPAEIQGFLLTRKKDPSRAVDEVARWRDDLLEARKKGNERSVDAGVNAAVEGGKAKVESEEKKVEVDGEHTSNDDKNPTSSEEATPAEERDAVRAENDEQSSGKDEKVKKESDPSGEQNGLKPDAEDDKDTKRERRETVTPATVSADLKKQVNDSRLQNGDAKSSTPKTEGHEVDVSTSDGVENGSDGQSNESAPEPYELKESLFDGKDEPSPDPTRTSSTLSEASDTSVPSVVSADSAPEE